MAKKYRLDIPEKLLPWVQKELRERQGEKSDMWDDRLYELGWITEIESSQTVNYQTNGQNTHICAICYQTFSVDELSINFAVCMECVSQSKKPNFCLDKNGVKFFPGSYLKNDASSATVRVLQIGAEHIIDDKNGFTNKEDFVSAGWIVHERVTSFEVGPTNFGVTKCKFKPFMIGDPGCIVCDHCEGVSDEQQWIICERYNREFNEPS